MLQLPTVFSSSLTLQQSLWQSKAAWLIVLTSLLHGFMTRRYLCVVWWFLCATSFVRIFFCPWQTGFTLDILNVKMNILKGTMKQFCLQFSWHKNMKNSALKSIQAIYNRGYSIKDRFNMQLFIIAPQQRRRLIEGKVGRTSARVWRESDDCCVKW